MAICPRVWPCGEYGLMTVTPSIWSTSSNSSVIAACTSGSSTPWSARKMIVPDRPLPAPPKYSSSVSKPRLDSESGIENELSLEAPIVPTSATTVTSAVTQAPRTNHRRRNAKRPSLPQAESGTSMGTWGAPCAGSYGRPDSSGWPDASGGVVDVMFIIGQSDQ